MKLLFLRGQVPSDRPASQITFDSLDKCDDMWTQLAYALLGPKDYGELWYEKGQRAVKYKPNFTERWVPRYAAARCTFKPDIVFSRGGFPYQLEEAIRHKEAFKIYYGAGARSVPKAGQPWDLVLTDTTKQYDVASHRGYRAWMLVKPAADNIFHPIDIGVKRKYDVIFVANYNVGANKGFNFLLPILNSSGLRVIHVGINRSGWRSRYANIDFVGWQSRRLLPSYYSMAKVAVVWTAGKDSCPRVVPEAMACGCPVLIGNKTRIWLSRYITETTGRVATGKGFIPTLHEMLAVRDSLHPREHYDKFLSLKVAAAHIRQAVDIVRDGNEQK